MIVGPVIAVLSFVCARSATFRSRRCCGRAGSRLGGVIAFLFADLIVLPIVLIYRKCYGGRFALRIVALLFVTIVVWRSRSICCSARWG